MTSVITNSTYSFALVNAPSELDVQVELIYLRSRGVFTFREVEMARQLLNVQLCYARSELQEREILARWMANLSKYGKDA